MVEEYVPEDLVEDEVCWETLCVQEMEKVGRVDPFWLKFQLAIVGGRESGCKGFRSR